MCQANPNHTKIAGRLVGLNQVCLYFYLHFFNRISPDSFTVLLLNKYKTLVNIEQSTVYKPTRKFDRTESRLDHQLKETPV